MHDNFETTRNPTDQDTIDRVGHLKGSDELTALILSYDKSLTSAGVQLAWPQALTTTLDAMLAPRFPM